MSSVFNMYDLLISERERMSSSTRLLPGTSSVKVVGRRTKK